MQWTPLHVDATSLPVSTTYGRNYFNRPSAVDDTAECVSWKDSSKEQHLSFDFESNYTEEMEEERERILEEMKELKTTAEWYLNPEEPVSVDGTARDLLRNQQNRHTGPPGRRQDYHSRYRHATAWTRRRCCCQWIVGQPIVLIGITIVSNGASVCILVVARGL